MIKAGRTKVRLAQRLTQAMAAHGLGDDLTIDPTRLMEAKGFWRTSGRGDNDALRWEGWVDRPGLSVSYHLVSDHTMTELLKADDLILTRRAPLQYWVDPRK
jgi:hypothetical protein